MYPAQSGPPNTSYPYGSIRNSQFDGDPAGTPLEAGWANDIQGFFASLLAKAGTTPNEVAETATLSQLADAVDTIARNFVRKGSFSWPDNSNVSVASEFYDLLPIWGAGTGSNFITTTTYLAQTSRTSSANWGVQLMQPPGRWQIMAMNGNLLTFDNTPSISPFRVSLNRVNATGTANLTTIASLQWGGGGSASELAVVNISGIGTHYMSGNQQYKYLISVEGEEDASENNFANLPKLSHLAVRLKYTPF